MTGWADTAIHALRAARYELESDWSHREDDQYVIRVTGRLAPKVKTPS